MPISFENIMSAFQEADIEGLIALGAPQDEYNQEAKDTAEAIQKIPASQLNEQSVAAVIAIIWAASFNLSDADIAKRKTAFTNTARLLI